MYKKQRLFLFARQINLYTIKERTNHELFFALKLAIRDFCLEKLCQHTPNATVNKSFLCLLKRYFALHNCLNCLIELEKVEKSSLASLFLRCLQFKEARKQAAVRRRLYKLVGAGRRQRFQTGRERPVQARLGRLLQRELLLRRLPVDRIIKVH